MSQPPMPDVQNGLDDVIDNIKDEIGIDQPVNDHDPSDEG